MGSETAGGREGMRSEFAGLFQATRQAALDHDRSKAELKALVPEDAREASRHGLRAKRSKSGGAGANKHQFMANPTVRQFAERLQSEMIKRRLKHSPIEWP